MEKSYRLDIDNLKIREALKALGIKKSELSVKTLEDFKSPDVSLQVSELRYENYKQKLNGLASNIQAFVRESNVDHLRSNSQQTRSSVSPSIQDTSTDRIRERHKSSLIQKIDEEVKRRELAQNFTHKSNRKSVVDEKLKQDIEAKKLKLDSKKAAQQERMKLLMTENIKKRKKINERINSHISKSPKNGLDEMKETNPSIKWTEMIKIKEERDRKEEKELINKLQQYHFKIVKSAELHEQMLKTKTEKISTHTQRVECNLSQILSTKEEKETNRIYKIITKVQENEGKRKNTEESPIKSKEKSKNKQEKIKQNLIEEEKKEKQRIKQIQSKINNSFDAIRQKKGEISKDLELKNEKLRLKEEEILENAARKRRADIAKKEKILEKHVTLNRRLEEMKEEKEKDNEKRREHAYITTLEKEKARKLQVIIEKSDNPTVMKKLIENY